MDTNEQNGESQYIFNEDQEVITEEEKELAQQVEGEENIEDRTTEVTEELSDAQESYKYDTIKYMNPNWEKAFAINKGRKQSITLDTNQHTIKTKKFFNGSTYTGEWNIFGIDGKGQYKLFYDVVYTGDTCDGNFCGLGSMRYPNGGTTTALFYDNQIIGTKKYMYGDGVVSDSQYPGDRRFNIEIEDQMRPAGRSYLTNSPITRKIPNGCYDAGDGFYNPRTKCVYDPNYPDKILRIPTKDEHNWILKNCRKAWDEVVGYRPDLYEDD